MTTKKETAGRKPMSLAEARRRMDEHQPVSRVHGKKQGQPVSSREGKKTSGGKGKR